MIQKRQTTRRSFLRQVAGLGAGWAAARSTFLVRGTTESRVAVAVMGLGRGMAHLEALVGLPGVEVTHVCDVDEVRLAAGVRWVAQRQPQPPQAVKDVRRILDAPEVDALTIAAPNHWHAPATILACSAGKHVYVEKPGSHNAQEAEWIVAAARAHQRVVQLGTQRRSWPGIIEMIERLRSGVIGPVRFARCFYTSRRGSIGRGKSVPVPATLDYTLWQGPAPERLYVDNLVHYNWHWRWHWGGGELANNGVHALDLAGWGLGVQHPARVSFVGGRYHFEDDQETPDTGAAVFDFGRQGILWDDSSCVARAGEPLPFVAFYGDGGSVMQQGEGYRVLDDQGKETSAGTGPGGDRVHFENFIAAIRDGVRLTAEIGEGQRAAHWCHLGNIAHRTRTELRVDPATGEIQGNREAKALWGREYRRGWTPRVRSSG